MKNTHHDQRGVVSLVVTMVMIIVISLIVLSFAQVTRHNQQEALDRQQSAQAYYAAESGINVGYQGLVSNVPADATDKTSCTSYIAKLKGSTPQIISDTTVGGADSGASFTCLKINATPDILTRSPLNQNTGVAWPLTESTGNPINKLNFAWQSDSGHSGGTCSSSRTVDQFSPDGTGTGKWDCNFGILRIDLIPRTAIGAGATASSLAANTATIFLEPNDTNNSGVTISQFGDTTQPTAYIGQCKIAGSSCSVTVNLTGAASVYSYYAHLTILYDNSDTVSVTGVLANGNPASWHGAQATIDATGKDGTQVRRVREAVSLSGEQSTQLPVDAVQSTSTICKLLTAGPNVGSVGGRTNEVDSCGP